MNIFFISKIWYISGCLKSGECFRHLLLLYQVYQSTAQCTWILDRSCNCQNECIEKISHFSYFCQFRNLMAKIVVHFRVPPIKELRNKVNNRKKNNLMCGKLLLRSCCTTKNVLIQFVRIKKDFWKYWPWQKLFSKDWQFWPF